MSAGGVYATHKQARALHHLVSVCARVCVCACGCVMSVCVSAVVIILAL